MNRHVYKSWRVAATAALVLLSWSAHSQTQTTAPLAEGHSILAPIHITPIIGGSIPTPAATRSVAPTEAAAAVAAAVNGINYHGGPVIERPINVYFIWYGNWTNDSATTILTDLASNIGGSRYFNINTTYYDTKTSVPNVVRFGGSYFDNYSWGTQLDDAAVASIVDTDSQMIAFPPDLDGMYFVMASADVNETSGQCSRYCGFHSSATIYASTDGGSIPAGTVVDAFIGNPNRCPTTCMVQQGTSPNGNPAADAMASVFAHELGEAATDPYGNAWWLSSNGFENGDLCNWNMGPTYAAPNGSRADIHLGSRDYLIQQNWVNAPPGFCAMSW